MKKVILEQRNINDDKQPKQLDTVIRDNKITMLDSTIPTGFTPDRAIVKLDNVAFTANTVPVVEDSGYTDNIKVYDSNGLECHTTKTILRSPTTPIGYSGGFAYTARLCYTRASSAHLVIRPSYIALAILIAALISRSWIHPQVQVHT